MLSTQLIIGTDDVRRGVGFDKPQLGDEGPTCGCVSMRVLDIAVLQEHLPGQIQKKKLYMCSLQ